MPKVNQYLSFVFLDHHSKIFIFATLPQIPHATTLTAHVGWLTSLLRRSHFIPILSTNQNTAMPTSSIRRRRGPIFRSRGIPMTHHYFQTPNVSSTSGWLTHPLHPHRHIRFYPCDGAYAACVDLKWDPFPICQISTSGLWLSWHFPQFLSFSDLFPPSRAPGETRSIRPSPSTCCFELSLALQAFRFCLFLFTNHQYTVSFLISRNSDTFSISSSDGLLLTLW